VTGLCNDLFMTQKESEITPVYISRVHHHTAFLRYFIYVYILMGYTHYVFF